MPSRKQDARNIHAQCRKQFWGIVALWTSVCAVASASQNVSLGWRPDAAGVAGYYIYAGVASRSYFTKTDVGTNNVATISALKEGQTNYFTVTAYNQAGIESAPAAEIAYIVPGVLRLLPKATSGDPATLALPVAPGHWYEVQASSDLKSWVTICQTQMATSNAWAQISDPQSGLFSSRYYRLVLH